MTKRIWKFLFCIIIASTLLNACQNPAAWYPTGTATIATYFETTVDSTKMLMATVKLTNSGTSTIHSSTATLSVESDQHSYFHTFSSDKRILPGASVYATLSVSYADSGESLKENGLAVIEAFFE